MSKKIKTILIIVYIFALLGTAIWLYNKPNLESFSVFIATFITPLIPILFTKNKDKINMIQKSGDNSTNYQAHGNININTKK